MALLGRATHAGDRCIRAPTQTPNTEPLAGSLHMAGSPPQSLTESWLPILSELGQLWVVRVSAEALWCSGSEMGLYLRAYTQLCKGLRRRTGSSQCSKKRPGRRCEEDGVRTGTRIQTRGRAGGVQQKPEG